MHKHYQLWKMCLVYKGEKITYKIFYIFLCFFQNYQLPGCTLYTEKQKFTLASSLSFSPFLEVIISMNGISVKYEISHFIIWYWYVTLVLYPYVWMLYHITYQYVPSLRNWVAIWVLDTKMTSIYLILFATRLSLVIVSYHDMTLSQVKLQKHHSVSILKNFLWRNRLQT